MTLAVAKRYGVRIQSLMSLFSCFQFKEAERKAIIEGIERNGFAQSERVIMKVLQKRHAQVTIYRYVTKLCYCCTSNLSGSCG